jgi:hypothetical protein
MPVSQKGDGRLPVKQNHSCLMKTAASIPFPTFGHSSLTKIPLSIN